MSSKPDTEGKLNVTWRRQNTIIQSTPNQLATTLRKIENRREQLAVLLVSKKWHIDLDIVGFSFILLFFIVEIIHYLEKEYKKPIKHFPV